MYSALHSFLDWIAAEYLGFMNYDDQFDKESLKCEILSYIS
jgi:hypothetical protein